MGPSPTYHPPEGGECETSVEHGLPLWAEPAVGYCSRRPRPSPMWGSRFVGARAVGPWVGERKPLGKTPCGATPSPESTPPPTLFPWLGVAVVIGACQQCLHAWHFSGAGVLDRALVIQEHVCRNRHVWLLCWLVAGADSLELE